MHVFFQGGYANDDEYQGLGEVSVQDTVSAHSGAFLLGQNDENAEGEKKEEMVVGSGGCRRRRV